MSTPTKDHHKTPQKIAAPDKVYKAFIENSSEGIWRIELEKPIPINATPTEQIKLMYKYAYMAEANEAMANMYGFKKASSLVGSRLGDLLIENDPANQAYLKAFIEAGYRLNNVDSHEVDKHGTDKYFRNSLVGLVENDKLIRAWGTQQDITDQHQALQDLKESEERLAIALKASRMGLWEWNVVDGTLTWSNELKQIFGLPAGAVITYELYQKMLDPNDTKTRKVIDEAFKNGSEYRIEHRVIWPDGSTHWILGHGKAIMENGKTVRMIGTGTSIDDWKEAEQAIRESEQRFRAMTDSAPVLIWEAGTDKLCNYLNQAWLEFTGRKLEEEIGDGWVEGIHPGDLERCMSTYNEAFDTRRPFSMEYRLRRHDNVYRWILDNGVPRFAPDGEFLGFIGSCMEIHEVKRAQKLESVNQTLTKQRSQLIALNKSKDEFISIASHQLRTPATGVKQYLGMLIDGYTGEMSKQQADFIKVAYASNERQLTIIDDLLKVAHIDAGKVLLHKSTTDLVELVKKVIHEQRAVIAGRSQSVTVLHTTPQVMCKLDAGRFRMVIENLIDNASKYSGKGKAITVTISESPGRAEVSISDTGVGIAKKDLEKLFQKFSRINNPLSEKVGGTGIGLYWAKRIIDLHDGSISVKSSLNKGSTFTIRIPKS